MKMIIYSDGACRGNPGPMTIGASIQDDEGRELTTVSEAIGHGTNNIAEYRAAIEGLKKAKEHGATKVKLFTDSQLVANHVSGAFKANSKNTKPLYAELMKLLSTFDKYEVIHLLRGQNHRADELANMAYIQLPALESS
jgi:ribonuclease HI